MYRLIAKKKMKRVVLSTVLVTLSVLFVFFAVTAFSSGSIQSQEKWEYKVLSELSWSRPDGIESTLNSLGAEGWELVSQGLYNGGANSNSYNSVILKRKLR